MACKIIIVNKWVLVSKNLAKTAFKIIKNTDIMYNKNKKSSKFYNIFIFCKKYIKN